MISQTHTYILHTHTKLNQVNRIRVVPLSSPSEKTSQLLILTALDSSSSRWEVLLISCCLVCSESGSVHTWGEEIMGKSECTRERLAACLLWDLDLVGYHQGEPGPQPYRWGSPILPMHQGCTDHKDDEPTPWKLVSDTCAFYPECQFNNRQWKGTWHSQGVFLPA